MKRFTFLTFLLLGAFAVKAQTTVLEVVSPAGNYYANQTAGVSVSWTLGEVATATYVNTSAGIMLTQGFQQGNLFGTIVPEMPVDAFGVQMYPNPANTETNLRVMLLTLTRVNITVLDITGRSVLMEAYDPEANDHSYTLNVSSLKSGIYLIKVNAGGKQQKVLKLIKQ